jgi:hypothetical protein
VFGAGPERRVTGGVAGGLPPAARVEQQVGAAGGDQCRVLDEWLFPRRVRILSVSARGSPGDSGSPSSVGTSSVRLGHSRVTG